MKSFILKFRLIILLIVVILLGIGSYFLLIKPERPSLPPPPPPALAVGIVNLSVIRNEALVFKSFKESVNGLYKTFHGEILNQETDLRKNYDEIKQLENTPNPPADLQKRRSDLDKQVSVLEKTIRDKKEQLNLKLATMTQEIEQAIHAIVIEVAQTQQLNLVFNATILDAPVVLYGGKELDITPHVLKSLDERLPAVHIH